jgi:hypothetical protein
MGEACFHDYADSKPLNRSKTDLAQMIAFQRSRHISKVIAIASGVFLLNMAKAQFFLSLQNDCLPKRVGRSSCLTHQSKPAAQMIGCSGVILKKINQRVNSPKFKIVLFWPIGTHFPAYLGEGSTYEHQLNVKQRSSQPDKGVDENSRGSALIRSNSQKTSKMENPSGIKNGISR